MPAAFSRAGSARQAQPPRSCYDTPAPPQSAVDTGNRVVLTVADAFRVRPVPRPISAGGGGVPVGADDGGVDLNQSVDVTGRIRAGLDLPQGPGEHTVRRVAVRRGLVGVAEGDAHEQSPCADCEFGADRVGVEAQQPCGQLATPYAVIARSSVCM